MESLQEFTNTFSDGSRPTTPRNSFGYPLLTALKTCLHSIQWHHKLLATPRPCNDYSCYGALEIVGAITITITIIVWGMGKATDFRFSRNIHRVHPNKSSLKILEKSKRGRIQTLPPI